MKTKKKARKGRAVRWQKMTGIISTRDFEAAGYSRLQVKRLADRGDIERLGRGLYVLPGTQRPEHHSLAEACKILPEAIVCMSSALEFHHMTTPSPEAVWVLLGLFARTPTFRYPRIRIFRASRESLTGGIEEHLIEGVAVRVTNVAKTVADCFKYRNKIGSDIAIEALKESRRLNPETNEPLCTREDLLHYARICRIDHIMRPYLDAMG